MDEYKHTSTDNAAAAYLRAVEIGSVLTLARRARGPLASTQAGDMNRHMLCGKASPMLAVKGTARHGRQSQSLWGFFAMKSRYGIDGSILADLRLRDQNCVYCHVAMPDKKNRTNSLHFATIEHLYPPGNDPRFVCWCCNGCNIRHKKPLRDWFKSPYCIERGINEHTVAPIIQEFLASGLKESDQLWLDGREDKFLKSASWGSPSFDGQQSIQKSTLSERDLKSFECIITAMGKRRYDFEFRGMKPGTFGRYYGFMYWLEGDALNRIPFDD